MNIVSLVLRIHPETRAAAEAALTAYPGVECHGMSDDGKLVVTVEDAEGAAMSDTLIALHRVQGARRRRRRCLRRTARWRG